MLNNQIYHKDYTEFGEPYQLVLPLNLEGFLEMTLSDCSATNWRN